METQEVTGNGTRGEGEGRDLKSCDLIGRAGSIPALGTHLLPVLEGELARSCNPDMTPHLI